MTHPARHEEHRVDVPTLYRVALLMGLGLASITVAMYVLWRQLPSSPALPVTAFHGARLQNQAPGDRRRTQARQRAELEQYRWLDPSHRTAQIPVERAMAMLVATQSGSAEARP